MSCLLLLGHDLMLDDIILQCCTQSRGQLSLGSLPSWWLTAPLGTRCCLSCVLARRLSAHLRHERIIEIHKPIQHPVLGIKEVVICPLVVRSAESALATAEARTATGRQGPIGGRE